MENLAKMVVEKLKAKGQKISVMESCTGGAFANAITNIPGASEIFEFGAVTYSNEFKIKMGVDQNVIQKFSVYSKETAREMSKTVAMFSGADFGVGITGKLKKVDPNNGFGKDDVVFFSVFKKQTQTFFEGNLVVTKDLREENKQMVVNAVLKLVFSII